MGGTTTLCQPTYLDFADDVCYFDDGVLSYPHLALRVHPAVHPDHTLTHAFLHGAHFFHS